MANKSTLGTCEMMVFCSSRESASGERECGDPGAGECGECGAIFCEDNDHGDEINNLCRSCREDYEGL